MSTVFLKLVLIVVRYNILESEHMYLALHRLNLSLNIFYKKTVAKKNTHAFVSLPVQMYMKNYCTTPGVGVCDVSIPKMLMFLL